MGPWWEGIFDGGLGEMAGLSQVLPLGPVQASITFSPIEFFIETFCQLPFHLASHQVPLSPSVPASVVMG